MSGPRGFVVTATLVAIIAGGLIGGALGILASQQGHIKKTVQLYLADLASIDMLYKGRNMQEYLDIGKEDILKEFAESGGPIECGTVNFHERDISVWKSSKCEVIFWPDYAKNNSGRIASREVSKYSSLWGIQVASNNTLFCLYNSAKMPFGNYEGDACFDSVITSSLSSLFSDMVDAYKGGPEKCACLTSYKVCWKDVGGKNFTYALRENC